MFSDPGLGFGRAAVVDGDLVAGTCQVANEEAEAALRELIAEITEFMTLHEGDVLITGTPEGRADVKPGEWQNLVVEIVDAQIRVVLDGKPVGYLKSSGIAHATKSRFEFGVAGQAAGHSGQFDDLKIYSASAK